MTSWIGSRCDVYVYRRWREDIDNQAIHVDNSTFRFIPERHNQFKLRYCHRRKLAQPPWRLLLVKFAIVLKGVRAVPFFLFFCLQLVTISLQFNANPCPPAHSYSTTHTSPEEMYTCTMHCRRIEPRAEFAYRTPMPFYPLSVFLCHGYCFDFVRRCEGWRAFAFNEHNTLLDGGGDTARVATQTIL